MAMITILGPAGDVRKRDLQRNNVSMAARPVGAPGYAVRKANLVVDAKT